MDSSTIGEIGDEAENRSRLALSGLTDDQFSIVQISGITSSALSLMISLYVLLLFWKARKLFWTKPIAERLCLFLEVSDAIFSSVSIANHIYSYINDGFPPEGTCAMIGSLQYTVMLYPLGFYLCSALEPCATIVVGRTLVTGKHDRRLLLPAFVIPSLITGPLFFLGSFGNSGIWCGHNGLSDNGRMTFSIICTVISLIIMSAFICYIAISFKIFKTAMKLKQLQDSGLAAAECPHNPFVKYRGNLRIMSAFMFAFIMQYWPFQAVYVAGMFGLGSGSFWFANFELALCIVGFVNIGGVLNYMAYVVVRKAEGGTSNVGPRPSEGTTVQA